MENIPQKQDEKQELTPMSDEEVQIINDIRKVNFGRVTVFIQDGTIMSKEVTVIVKNKKHKNNDYGNLKQIEEVPNN